MKRLFLIVLVFIVSFGLSACSSRDFSNIYNDIDKNIDDSFTSDLILPEVTDDGISVVYKIGDLVLANQILPYEYLFEDKEIELDIYLSDGLETKKYRKNIVMMSVMTDEEIAYINDVVETLHIKNQVVYKGDTQLAYFDNDNVLIEYSSTCVDINNRVLVYPFKEEDMTCYIDSSITYNEITYLERIPASILGTSGLEKTPEIHITTVNDLDISRFNGYKEASLSVVGNGYLYSDITNESLIIKARGNSTLLMDKLSYKLKFDNKVSLLNEHSERDWVLLANHADHTLIRNALAFQLAEDIGMEFSPSYVFVDLYINDEYKGNYMLTDQIEVTNDRVDVLEHSVMTDTGFLIEYDNGYFRDFLEFGEYNVFSAHGISFVIKTPNKDDETYRDEQKSFIRSYFIDMLDTLENKEDYSEYIDDATFIDWYIINEVFKNADSGFSSIYFYKDSGDLLKMGPVWDFDLSLGNYGHMPLEHIGPTGLFTSLEEQNIIFYYLMQYDSFKLKLKLRWNEIYDDVSNVLNNVYLVSNDIILSRNKNFDKWNVIGKTNGWYSTDEITALNSYDEEIYFIYQFLKTRIEWMDEEFNTY